METKYGLTLLDELVVITVLSLGPAVFCGPILHLTHLALKQRRVVHDSHFFHQISGLELKR